jgi:hypothetical protein
MPQEHFDNLVLKIRFLEDQKKKKPNPSTDVNKPESAPQLTLRPKGKPPNISNQAICSSQIRRATPVQASSQANLPAQLTPGATGEPVLGSQTSIWIAPVTPPFQLNLAMPAADPQCEQTPR